MSDLVSQNLNMIFKTPKGETVHALKDVNFTLKKGELLTVLGTSRDVINSLMICAACVVSRIVCCNPRSTIENYSISQLVLCPTKK